MARAKLPPARYHQLQNHTDLHVLQVLEQIVYPTLSSLATAGSTQASQVLNLLRSPESTADWQGRPPMSIDAAHRALQWMPAMQEWAILSLLVCPSRVLIQTLIQFL